MHILFICNQNKNRSKIAEQIFRREFATRSAGLYNDKPVSAHDLDWADIIFVMEEEQRAEIGRRFPQQYMSKRILNLNIPDIYTYGDARLVLQLRDKVTEQLELLQPLS